MGPELNVVAMTAGHGRVLRSQARFDAFGNVEDNDDADVTEGPSRCVADTRDWRIALSASSWKLPTSEAWFG